MNRDFLDYLNLYDAKNHLFELQTRRLDIERTGDMEWTDEPDFLLGGGRLVRCFD